MKTASHSIHKLLTRSPCLESNRDPYPPSMPASFTRLDLPSSTHLSHSLSTILSHAQSLLHAQLERDGLSGSQEEEVCRKLLQAWLDEGERRLVEGNVTFDGMKVRRDWKEKQGGGKSAGE